MDTTVNGAETQTVGRARRFAFFAVLILFALTHYPVPLFAILGWFIEEGATSHRVHEIVFGFIFTMNLVGLLAQLRKPELRVAQMYQVFIISWLLVATTVIVDREIFINVVFFFVLPPVLVILHPARDQLLRPVVNLSRVLLILLLAAAIPLVYYAVNEFRIGLDASRVATPVFEIVENRLPDDATEDEFEDALLAELRRATDSNEEFEAAQHSGHWSTMGAFALIILGLAGVAALRPLGWRVPAWCAGLSAILYGSASFANAGDASSATGIWAMLAIVWGAAFILAVERERRELQPASEAAGQPAPA